MKERVKKRSRPDAGFVLLEALAALFVLTVGIIAAVIGLSSLLRTASRTEARVAALLEAKSAQYRVWYETDEKTAQHE